MAYSGRPRVLPCLAWMLFLLAGCDSSVNREAARIESSNLKQVAIIHGQYVREHEGRLPPSDEAFRQYVAASAQGLLQKRNLTPDALLTSERDGQPFVVVTKKPLAIDGNAVAAYERQGVDGKRMVGFDIGDVQEFDNTRLQQLIPDAR